MDSQIVIAPIENGKNLVSIGNNVCYFILPAVNVKSKLKKNVDKRKTLIVVYWKHV